MPEVKEGLIHRINKFLSALKNLPLAFALVWEAARGWTLVWAILLLFQGFMPAATVYLTRPLVDSLVRAVQARYGFENVVFWGGLMAGVIVLSEILQKCIVLVRRYQSELLRDHISTLIHNQSLAADYAFYDMAGFYDHLHRARSDAIYRPEAMLESLGSLAQNSVTLLLIGVVILAYGWWLPVVLLLSTLPAMAIVLYWTLKHYAWRRRTTPDERRQWYFDWLMTSSDAAAEVRLFNLGGHFQDAWKNVRLRLRKEQLEMGRQQSLAEIAAELFALVVTLGTLAWMAWRAFNGRITLGILALFYQSLNQGQRLMHSLLDNVGQLYANSLFLGNLFEFLDLKPAIIDPPDPLTPPDQLQKGINFKNISFSYPAGRGDVLKDFSLEIPAGRVTAIVGLNGAGKSTLFKLLCRLYDVDSGSITIDDLDLRRFRPVDLRRRITMLFQNPVHYSQTVEENISLGDLDKAPTGSDIESAAVSAGADEIIEKLPQGYQQQLGKWFSEGTDLSTGEWQRIALARAFLRQAPIILLDEPTSAMDSWAETAWMGQFRKLAEGKTSIIITHRFTTAMQADMIHVMVDGKIIESGNHRQLVAHGGFYARSWAAQMREAAGQ